MSGDKSVIGAANAYGIPRTTLTRRVKGGHTRKVGLEPYQRLSIGQENRLVDWVIAQDALGLAPTHTQIRGLVTRLLRVQGDHAPLGKDWMTRFIHRHPPIRTLRGRPLDTKRAPVVSHDPNRKFVTIEDIIKQREAVRKGEAAGIEQASLEEMCNEFQVTLQPPDQSEAHASEQGPTNTQ